MICFRDLYKQYKFYLLIPALENTEPIIRIERFITIMDSMTNQELDDVTGTMMNVSRMERIARGSGCSLKDVYELVIERKRIDKLAIKLENTYTN